MIRVKLTLLSTAAQIMKKINRWIKLYDGSASSSVTTLNFVPKNPDLNCSRIQWWNPGRISDHYICMGPDRIETSEPISSPIKH